MVVAVLCIVHCILFPLLILLIPTARGFFDSILVEGLILLLGITVGSISFTTSYKKHRKPGPLMLGFSGVALLTIDLFVLSDEISHIDMFGLEGIHPAMILGGIFLIMGHAWNIHECHCFCDKSCDHDEHHQHDHEHKHDHSAHSH